MNIDRLANRKDVYGVIVATMDGRILYECESLKTWISPLASLCTFARHLVRNHDPTDYIRAVRLKTKTYELIITIRNEQMLIVMQMLNNRTSIERTTEKSFSEEDWEAFLKRIQEQQKKLLH